MCMHLKELLDTLCRYVFNGILHLFRVTSTNNYLHQKHTRNNSLVAWIVSRPFSLLSYIPVRIATYLRIRFELIVGQFMPSYNISMST